MHHKTIINGKQVANLARPVKCKLTTAGGQRKKS